MVTWEFQQNLFSPASIYMGIIFKCVKCLNCAYLMQVIFNKNHIHTLHDFVINKIIQNIALWSMSLERFPLLYHA